jgi:hypothetical protein
MDEKRGPLRKREEPHHGSPRFQESRLEHAAAPVLVAFLCDALLRQRVARSLNALYAPRRIAEAHTGVILFSTRSAPKLASK